MQVYSAKMSFSMAFQSSSDRLLQPWGSRFSTTRGVVPVGFQFGCVSFGLGAKFVFMENLHRSKLHEVKTLKDVSNQEVTSWVLFSSCFVEFILESLKKTLDRISGILLGGIKIKQSEMHKEKGLHCVETCSFLSGINREVFPNVISRKWSILFCFGNYTAWWIACSILFLNG